MSKLIPKQDKKPVPKRYLSEEAVKRALRIRSFDTMPKEKVARFTSLIPYMDPETAAEAIAQFPEFAEFGKEIVSSYSQTCSEILQNDTESQNASIYAYQSILDSLRERMESDNISESERRAITADMVEVADKIAEVDLQNKRFLTRLAMQYGAVALAIAGLIATGIGVAVKFGDN